MMTKKTPVIMKHPKLYTKNEKGRYEEYQIPDMDVSETLFRRINGKYVPVSVNCTNDLPEGVWVVTRGRGSRETISGEYLKDLFTLNKMSNIEKVSFAELADMHRTANEIVGRMPDEYRCKNLIEIVHTTLRLLKEIQDEK